MGFQVKDHYYHKAKKGKFLARSVFKLEEIDKRYKVLKKGDSVLDLGYHPGSWSQYASEKIGENGLLVGIDIKEVNKQLLNLKNVRLFQKDIFEIEELAELGVDKLFDVLISDMAPNTTGIKSVDQERSLGLVEAVFNSLSKFLKKNGNLVIKVFDGHEAQVFLKEQKKMFRDFNYLRPKSTRSTSKEFYVIAKGYNL